MGSMTKQQKQTIVFLAAAFAAALIFLVILFFRSPYEHEVTICVFHKLTRLRCPGCGMTRALYHVLHLNFPAALRENAFVFVLPVPVYMALVEMLRHAFPKLRLRQLPVPNWLLWTVLGLWVAYGLGRNFV